MNRILGNIMSALNTVGAMGVLLLMLLICGDVFGRVVFHSPIVGVPEIVKFTIVGMVWLQFAHALRNDRHLRSDLFLSMMAPRLRSTILVINAIFGAGILLCIAWFGMHEAFKSWKAGDFEGDGAFKVAVWPIWGIITIGSALTGIQYLMDAFSPGNIKADSDHHIGIE